jgi:hypothetical protein
MNEKFYLSKRAQPSVKRTAESLFKIIQFLFYRVPEENKKRFLSKLRGKVIRLNPTEMSGKKLSPGATIGQSISLAKNILFGLNPIFIKQVLVELVRILIAAGNKKADTNYEFVKNASMEIEIQNALDFNKSAINYPSVAKLLGIVSGFLNMKNFYEPWFVLDLALWQEENNLEPTGKLDKDTINKFEELKPKGELPNNFGVVIPGLVYRGAIINKLEQLENLQKNYNIQRVISLHDNSEIARMCNILNIIHVPAFLENGSPNELGRKVLGNDVLSFIGDVPTYIHCFRGADRASGVIARIRTESGWPCKLAYAEAKAYGFQDMFVDLIDWFSELCKDKLDIDTNKIREFLGNKPPYENSEITIMQNLIEPTPTDAPYMGLNNMYETYSDTVVNNFGIGTIPMGRR